MWVPWALWQAYGNRQVLSDQFDSMVAHVRRVESLLSPTGLWDAGFQFGDWLDPTAPPDQPALSKADKGVVATACLYRDARILADTASFSDEAMKRGTSLISPSAPELLFMIITSTRTAPFAATQNGVHVGHRLRPA